MDKVLVTGGLGTIGAFVCRALLDSSRQPVVYDVGTNTQLIADITGDCIIETGNICDLPRLIEVSSLYKPIAIAHVAGPTGPRVEQFPWQSLASMLIGTQTVFECARLASIPRVVFASSKAVYGPVAENCRHPSYAPVFEDHPREPIRLYSKLKRASEDIADHYAKLYGLDIAAMRFGSVIAPGKYGRHHLVSPIMALIDGAIANRSVGIMSGAEQADDFCYAADCANGILSALDAGHLPARFRAYNISSGELISLREIIKTLEELFPSWSGEAAPGLDYRNVGVGHYFRMSIEKARAELSFKPRFDFRSAVSDYAEIMRKYSSTPAS